jgi:hypothetical protein
VLCISILIYIPLTTFTYHCKFDSAPFTRLSSNVPIPWKDSQNSLKLLFIAVRWYSLKSVKEKLQRLECRESPKVELPAVLSPWSLDRTIFPLLLCDNTDGVDTQESSLELWWIEMLLALYHWPSVHLIFNFQTLWRYCWYHVAQNPC